MSTLRLIALEDTVVFPGMTVTLPVDVGEESQVLLVPRHGTEYANVGTVADVVERVRLPGRGFASVVTGLHRGIAGAARTDPQGRLRVEVKEVSDGTPPPSHTRELEREYRAVVGEILELRGADERVSQFVRSITEPGALADTAGYAPDLTFAQKGELLQTLDVVERLTLALRVQRERLAELQVRKRIREDGEAGAQKQQREYFLRRQMDSIRKELGEDEGSVADEYRKKIAEAGMPEAVQQQAEREVGRLAKMGEANPETSMIRTYLDWLLAVPWSKRSEERLRPPRRRAGAPRRRPRRARRREEAHPRVPGRPEAAGRARRAGGPPLGRHPDAHRAARDGQDVDRRVDRARDGAEVCSHVARRRARR